MRSRWIFAAAGALVLAAPALVQAAPPTVTPSPGYDRALQQSRAAASGTATTVAPVSPANPPVASHRHGKKKHTN